MNWLGRIISKSLGVDLEKRIQETLLPHTIDYDPSDRPKEYYRPITQEVNRNLAPLTQQKMINSAFRLFDENPIARRIVYLYLYYMVGAGLDFRAEEPQVEKRLAHLWYGAVNNFQWRQFIWPIELSLYGELCKSAWVNKTSGAVNIGHIDPLEIYKVHTDPDNGALPIGIELKPKPEDRERTIPRGQGRKGEYAGGKRYRIIQAGDGSEMGDAGQEKIKDFDFGQCFYWRINAVDNSPRGRSDLLPLIDFCDAYDDFLFNRMDRAKQINNFVWKYFGFASQKEAMDFKKMNLADPPRPGDNMILWGTANMEAVAPDLKAQDADTDARMTRNHIVGNAGFPESWFGFGGETNLSTAIAQGTPTFKMLSFRQGMYVRIIEEIVDYALAQAADHANLDKKWLDDASAYSIIAPPIDVVDIQRQSSSLLNFTNALAVAQVNKWVTQPTAARAFIKHLNDMGIETDAEEELKALEAEATNQGASDTANAALNAILAKVSAGGNGGEGNQEGSVGGFQF